MKVFSKTLQMKKRMSLCYELNYGPLLYYLSRRLEGEETLTCRCVCWSSYGKV